MEQKAVHIIAADSSSDGLWEAEVLCNSCLFTH